MTDKRISSSGSRISPKSAGSASAVPFNIVGPLRRFWNFAKKTAKGFANNFDDPEAKEAEFMKTVEKDSKNW